MYIFSVYDSINNLKCIMTPFLARQHFINFHGQPAARLDRDRSVHHPSDKVHKRPWLMRCMSPALFSAPDLYYRQLTKLYVDGLVHESSWADFVMKMYFFFFSS